MPMPHRTQMQVIRRRLVGKEGTERIRELRAILGELPDYRNGPYADIRKWVNAQIEVSRMRAKVVHRDSISVRREGAAQIALVGPPNAGKSSLLQALSHIQIKTGDYAFTTVRPVPALTRIGGVLVQLVEIPGLIEGAGDDRGGGRALLGVLRNADAIVYCQEAAAPLRDLEIVRAEVAAAGIAKPAVLAATKLDEVDLDRLDQVRRAVPDLDVIGVSVLDDATVEDLRAAIWRLTGLIRVWLHHNGSTDPQPLALPPGATITEVAAQVHRELAASFVGALVWGPPPASPGNGWGAPTWSPTATPSRSSAEPGRRRGDRIPMIAAAPNHPGSKIITDGTDGVDLAAGVLDELVTEGARRMLMAALESEVADNIERRRQGGAPSGGAQRVSP